MPEDVSEVERVRLGFVLPGAMGAARFELATFTVSG